MTKQYNTAYFIERANKIHNGLYDYSLSEYKHSKKKLKIICDSHGVFLQSPNSHLKGAGCPKCKPNYKIDKKEFVQRAIKKHGKGKYDYKKSKYTGVANKLTISCKRCGNDFSQNAGDHLQGYGCPHCARNTKLTTKEFIEKSIKTHGNYYDYSKTEYKSSNSKVLITCPIHGVFKQRPADHMRGVGCSECGLNNSKGWTRTGYIRNCKKYNYQSNLYVIECNSENEVFYKVGITCETITKRFRHGYMPYDYKLIELVSGDAGFIWDLEKQIERLIAKHKYEPLVKFGGSTECYKVIPKNILKLLKGLQDTEQLQLLA